MKKAKKIFPRIICVPEDEDSSSYSVTIDRSRMTSTENRFRNTYRCPGWPIRLTEDEFAQVGTYDDRSFFSAQNSSIFLFLWRDFNCHNRMIGAEQIGQYLTRAKQRDRIPPKKTRTWGLLKNPILSSTFPAKINKIIFERLR